MEVGFDRVPVNGEEEVLDSVENFDGGGDDWSEEVIDEVIALGESDENGENLVNLLDRLELNKNNLLRKLVEDRAIGSDLDY